MLELLDKIKFKKLWFALIIAPLFFTPVFDPSYSDYEAGGYEGLTVGPQLAFPIGGYNTVGLIGWPTKGIGSPFGWRTYGENPRELFVDWGRIAYWEAWMMTICFVVNRKRLFQDKEQ
jgi:hypothetical protein